VKVCRAADIPQKILLLLDPFSCAGSISLLFFATFLVFYISVLVSMPDRSATEIEFSTQELVFWAWVAVC
jgi:hypothetical protein